MNYATPYDVNGISDIAATLVNIPSNIKGDENRSLVNSAAAVGHEPRLNEGSSIDRGAHSHARGCKLVKGRELLFKKR